METFEIFDFSEYGFQDQASPPLTLDDPLYPREIDVDDFFGGL
ncbi:hypothetical protein FRC0190_01866 [Corynebacterium rouxii]|uniref:Uncharacterized protein n=1 Tax=Corynebacterium rouxii TaxID=2719119 RepID=A0A6I8MDS9_9CORY|nr:hypothetical protein FRC0190_01866 [Corynebacterium rouxii]